MITINVKGYRYLRKVLAKYSKSYNQAVDHDDYAQASRVCNSYMEDIEETLYNRLMSNESMSFEVHLNDSIDGVPHVIQMPKDCYELATGIVY